MLKPDIAEKENFNVEGITVVQSKAKCKHCDEIPLPVRKKEGGKKKDERERKEKNHAFKKLPRFRLSISTLKDRCHLLFF